MLLLGWTDKTALLIEELCLACESDGGGVIVVLADCRVATMETELHHALPRGALRGTSVVLRSGLPCVPTATPPQILGI